MPSGIGLVAELVGVLLIVLGLAAAGIADDLLFVVGALGFESLGVSLLLLVDSGVASALLALVLGAGSLAILATGEALRPGPNARSSPRAFDLIVVVLAVAGAMGLAATRPPFPNLPLDVAFTSLIVAGLLFCLRGGNGRLACGLIFLLFGAALLLQSAEPDLSLGERVLLAATQLSLILALSLLWTVSGDPNLPRPHRRRARPRPVDDLTGGDAAPGGPL